MERPGALPRLQRHPEQPADALARGHRPRERVPHAVQQQQRQHVRLPGPPALLRAPDAAGSALRERRLDHHPCGVVRGQAPQLPERRRPPSGRELLVHRPALRRAALRGGAGRRRRAEQPGRAAQEPPGPGRGDRQRKARAADELLPDRPEREDRPRRHRAAGPRPERALLLARLQEALHRQHREGAGRPGSRRQGRHPRLRCRERQQALQPEALLGLHGRRREVRAGRRPLRRRRQPLGVEQRGTLRRLQRRPRLHAGGQADRTHPAPGDLRQRLLRRARSGTACSWPAASPCTPSTSTRRGPRPARPRNIQIGIREPGAPPRAPGSRSPHPRAPPTPSRGARRSRRPP